jgi:anaerobic dimethyl sulfoxide reductase subunit B
MPQYAFFFDSSSCSGCKACQVACKDKHDLPVGVLWRRVYEISGGDWLQVGEAWLTDVFAYNLSISCNHCQSPICAEVCPVRAITRRPDGIVLIDDQRCIGCKYCSWACPYGAPQVDVDSGRMTKCTFCYDNLEVGLPPACVAACPMRCLDFGNLADLEARYGKFHAIDPLPDPGLTQPALVINPHQAALRSSASAARVSNREEV